MYTLLSPKIRGFDMVYAMYTYFFTLLIYIFFFFFIILYKNIYVQKSMVFICLHCLHSIKVPKIGSKSVISSVGSAIF